VGEYTTEVDKMNRWIKYLSILMVGLFVLVPVASAVGQGPGANQKPGFVQNMERAEEKNCFGQFKDENGSVEGRFVKFNYDAEAGMISDYQVYDGTSYISVFEHVEIHNFTLDEVQQHGAVFWMNGTHSRMMVHNNPTSIIQITNPYDDEPLNISYTVTDQITISEGDTGAARTYTLEAKSGDFVGYINTPLNTTLEGSVINVEGDDSMENSGHSLFITKPGYTGQREVVKEQLQQAIKERKIGGEVEVIGDGENHVSHKVQYRQNLEMHVSSMEKNKMRIRVQSEDPNGTCVTIRVNEEAMKMTKEQVRVKMDGEKVQKADLDEVLKGGDEAKYNVQKRENGVLEITTNIPSFSEHEISIVKAEDEAPGFVVPITLGVLLVTAIVWTVKKKK